MHLIKLTTIAKISPGIRHKKPGRKSRTPKTIVRMIEKIKIAGLAFCGGSITAT